MSDERKIFLYFLTDPLGRSYYYENGVVKVSTTPKPLSESPGGWIEQGISFGRSQKYFGINRTFTQPLKFVDDGASIIRNLFYKRKGIEERLILIILKWDDETDIYELEYKGELDLAKMTDLAAEGIEVNIMEGGIVKLLKSYENTVYEFPCDGSIPENKLVKMDGILFNDTFKYSILNVDYREQAFTMPLVFLSNTGYNSNIAEGSQNIEDLDAPISAYVASSPNYFFKTFRTTTININGKIKFQNIDLNIIPTVVTISLWTSNNVKTVIYTGTVARNQVVEIILNQSLTLNNEAVFLILEQSTAFRTLRFEETSINIDFSTRFDTSKIWAISARDLWTKLVEKVGGGVYTAVSTLLDSKPEFFITSGDAIRGAKGAVIKTSLADFFDSMNTILNVSMSNQQPDPTQPEQLFLEEKGYVFDPSTVTLDLGEVSELKITVADQYIFNTLKIGYAPQQYDTPTGRQEFNTTALFNTPISRLQKELNLVSKYRADAFGIEFTRIESPGKSTTKNSSDNSVFILNVDTTPTAQQYSALRTSVYDLSGGEITEFPFEVITGDGFNANLFNTEFTYAGSRAVLYDIVSTFYGTFTATAPDALTISLKQNGTVIGSDTIVGDGTSQAFALNILLTGIVISPNDVFVLELQAGFSVTGSVTEAGITLTSEVFDLYQLKREAYTSITGIDNPSSLFNIAELTPHLLALKHGNYLRSVLYNLVDQNLTFQTLDKNKDLSRVIGGQTIVEKSDIPIGSLDSPLFYPYIIECKANMPMSTVEVFNNAANGHVKLTYNGKSFYGFPIQVTVKPALNESQEVKLLISPRTNLYDLVDLDVDGLNYNVMGDFTLSIPHLCPVRFVPLNPVLDPKYHFVQMDADWFQNQVKFYIAQAKYYQKYQKNDTAKLQVRTNGLGPVQIDVYNCRGEIVETLEMDQITTPAIVAPNALFEANISFADYDEGVYAMVMTAGTGGTVAQVISEMIYIKQDWPMTLLLEYTNNRNKQSTIFSTGYAPSFRVEGWIDDFQPASKFTVYEDQPADLQLINGIPFRRYRLNIGINDGVAPWVIDKINRIMLLTSTSIDGLAYTRNGEAQFEKIDVPGWPMKYWTLDIREAANRDSVSVSTDGTLDNNLVMLYNIRTLGFGDGSTDGVVQVTEIDK